MSDIKEYMSKTETKLDSLQKQITDLQKSRRNVTFELNVICDIGSLEASELCPQFVKNFVGFFFDNFSTNP